ncbi:MAG: hypothetical protein GYB35_05455 [Algicola sp.]|nr:hypothetical protein [Algicola sp.]
MKTISTHKADAHKRLCISKDLKELELWLQCLEFFNEELDHFKNIEKDIIKNISISNNITALRRKTILEIASICKYEQALKTEHEYGKIEYDDVRSKQHDQKRQNYLRLLKEQNAFKHQVFAHLNRFKRN